MPAVVLRHLRHEADARPGSLYRHHADRDLCRSHRPDDANVADNALLLEVLAGPDGYDPRQYNVKTHPYTKVLEGGIKGMKIGIVTEGFAQPNAEADVNAKVQGRGRAVRDAGRHGERGLDPHAPRSAAALWMPIGAEGLTQTMMWGDGYGVSRPDLYVTSLMDFHRNWRNRANEMSRDHQAVHHARHLHPQILRQPLLRQGDEHHTRLSDRRLRRGAGASTTCC